MPCLAHDRITQCSFGDEQGSRARLGEAVVLGHHLASHHIKHARRSTTYGCSLERFGTTEIKGWSCPFPLLGMTRKTGRYQAQTPSHEKKLCRVQARDEKSVMRHRTEPHTDVGEESRNIWPAPTLPGCFLLLRVTPLPVA